VFRLNDPNYFIGTLLEHLSDLLYGPVFKIYPLYDPMFQLWDKTAKDVFFLDYQNDKKHFSLYFSQNDKVMSLINLRR